MEILTGICLMIQSMCDIRTKEIPLWISLGFSGCGCLYSICSYREWTSFCIALIPGILCLFLGFCTRQAIGYGDGILICSLATFYSLEEIIHLLVLAVIFAGIVGLVLLVVFHKNGKYELPFVPFLFVGWMLLRGFEVVQSVLEGVFT